MKLVGNENSKYHSLWDEVKSIPRNLQLEVYITKKEENENYP